MAASEQRERPLKMPPNSFPNPTRYAVLPTSIFRSNFLYRHSIELFLKSMLVVLHRSPAMPYGNEPSEGIPKVIDHGKWKPMHRVHSVGVLWSHVVMVIRENEQELKKRCRTDWAAFPAQIHNAIARIEELDPKSTYFRYTDRRASEEAQAKSSWKERDPSEIVPKDDGDHVKAFLALSAGGEIVRGPSNMTRRPSLSFRRCSPRLRNSCQERIRG